MDFLACVEVEPIQDACATVIWLHGLGADGHDFTPIVGQLQLPQDLPIRFVFPHAPCIPVTINQKQLMPAWYDLSSMDFNLVQISDRDGLVVAAQKIGALIDRERQRGIPSERIIVAGFSQGGAVAYQVALTYPHPLAGLLAMSTYFASDVAILQRQERSDLPIQIYHGTEDSVVPHSVAKKAYWLLKDADFMVDFLAYPMQHSVCDRQLLDITQWLKIVLQYD